MSLRNGCPARYIRLNIFLPIGKNASLGLAVADFYNTGKIMETLLLNKNLGEIMLSKQLSAVLITVAMLTPALQAKKSKTPLETTWVLNNVSITRENKSFSAAFPKPHILEIADSVSGEVLMSLEKVPTDDLYAPTVTIEETTSFFGIKTSKKKKSSKKKSKTTPIDTLVEVTQNDGALAVMETETGVPLFALEVGDIVHFIYYGAQGQKSDFYAGSITMDRQIIR